MALLSCPFCRTLYTTSEAKICPECGLELIALERLRPSDESEAEGQSPRWPEHETLPWTFWGRGRGPLLVLALLGLAAFFLPWVELTFPDRELRSGFELARGRAGWLWGGAVGWFVLLPLVWSRRSIAALRGIRPISAAFAVMTLAEVLMLIVVPPSVRPVPMRYEWAFGLHVSAAVSAIATLVALRLGGSLPPLPMASTVAPKSSDGETIH